MSLSLDLLTIKSKPLTDQEHIVEAILKHVQKSPALDHLRNLAELVEPLLPRFSDETLVRTWILAIYAADIGTLPDKVSRQNHLSHLGTLANHYSIPVDTALRLSAGADRALAWFEAQL